MKAALLVLTITAAPTAAVPSRVSLVPLARVDKPSVELGATETTCEGEGKVLALRRVVGTTTVEALHDCGGTPAHSSLAIHTSRGWFVSADIEIAYSAGNMTEFPLHTTLASERLETGQLADGTRALLHMVVTNERTDTVVHVMHVQICSADDEPACGELVYACGAKPCPSNVRLSRGTLIIGTERRTVQR